MSKIHLPQRYLPGELEEQYRQLPDKFRESSRVPDEIRKAIRACMDAEKPWPLLIVGPVGAGKTCAGLLLCDVVGGRYHTVSSLRQRQVDAKMGRLYTDSYFSAAKVTEAEMWGEVQLSRLFVLDELAADPGAKEPERQMVQSVLDHREGKPLLLLSNRDPKEIAEIYGGPVGSRAAAGTILWHRGEDMREQTREVLS